MPLSLHAAAIPSMLQLLVAGKTWLNKAEASDLAEADIVNASLTDDMLPFSFQIKSMAVHSMGAIEGLRKGVFSPDLTQPPSTLAGMRAKLEEAESFLTGLAEDELESFIGKDMRFEAPDYDMLIPFTGENFLLSFSQPNFYFHAATAYGILRAKGIQLGKMDYMGALRVKMGA